MQEIGGGQSFSLPPDELNFACHKVHKHVGDPILCSSPFDACLFCPPPTVIREPLQEEIIKVRILNPLFIQSKETSSTAAPRRSLQLPTFDFSGWSLPYDIQTHHYAPSKKMITNERQTHDTVLGHIRRDHMVVIAAQVVHPFP